MNEKDKIKWIGELDSNKDVYESGLYCIEEMSELTKSICKMKRGGCLSSVYEELSHVLLTAEILVQTLNCEKEVVVFKQRALDKALKHRKKDIQKRLEDGLHI